VVLTVIVGDVEGGLVGPRALIPGLSSIIVIIFMLDVGVSFFLIA